MTETSKLPDARTSGVEFRISWRRGGWSATTKTKTRRFARWIDAQMFLGKLTGNDRPDLSDLSMLRIDSRTVGTWQEVGR